jgi:hypothetical protein
LPSGDVEGVARLIADPVPPGLLDYLEYFRDFVGAARPDPRRDKFGQLLYSIDDLMEWLPFFQHLPLGLECPDDVAVALKVLPRVRRLLEPLAVPPGRKRLPNVFKQTAAEIIVTACRRFSPDIGSRSAARDLPGVLGSLHPRSRGRCRRLVAALHQGSRQRSPSARTSHRGMYEH